MVVPSDFHFPKDWHDPQQTFKGANTLKKIRTAACAEVYETLVLGGGV